jgi:hypothetical protein
MKMTLEDLKALFTLRRERVIKLDKEPKGKPLAALPRSQGERQACIGGCGARVTGEMGECRDCRRARIHKGLKHIRATNKKEF